jgi:hypothetical protein
MSAPWRYWMNLQPVSLLKPAADSGGRTSTFVSLRNAQKATVVFYINQGNAATILLSVLQATDQGGDSSKAVSACPIATNLDCDTTPADALTQQAAAATYTTDAGTKTKLVFFEIDPVESMDMANGFYHIGVSTGASSASNITSAQIILGPLRYAQQVWPTSNA